MSSKQLFHLRMSQLDHILYSTVYTPTHSYEWTTRTDKQNIKYKQLGMGGPTTGTPS